MLGCRIGRVTPWRLAGGGWRSRPPKNFFGFGLWYELTFDRFGRAPPEPDQPARGPQSEWERTAPVPDLGQKGGAVHTTRFQRLVTIDVADCDADTAAAFLADITVLRRVLDGREVAVMGRLELLADDDVAVDPEKINARATCRPTRAAAVAAKRARAAAAFRAIGDAVDAGELNAEFLDAFQGALGLLPAQFRPELILARDRTGR